MAPELAVYASPDESPQYGARLASMCWSDSHGRAFHPQGSYERFPICFLHLVLLSQASLGAILFSVRGFKTRSLTSDANREEEPVLLLDLFRD